MPFRGGGVHTIALGHKQPSVIILAQRLLQRGDLNYGLPLFGLFLIALIRRQTNKRAASHYAAILGTTDNGRV